jgi:HCOMODA/2-hydroxy-3-carboxy-muconic semialdehyde decarboxylase
MGMIAPNENGTVVPIDGPLPEGVLGEVRVHQQIYKRRPDVNGIARTFPPNVLALSALKLVPVARHGFGAYFAPQPPFWDDPLLLRSDGLAANFAEALGSARAIVIRGNGAVTVGDTLETAVVLAWYLEDAARVELAVLASGVANPPIFTAEQAEARAITAGQIFERMWSYLTRDDGAEDNGFNRGV